MSRARSVDQTRQAGRVAADRAARSGPPAAGGAGAGDAPARRARAAVSQRFGAGAPWLTVAAFVLAAFVVAAFVPAPAHGYGPATTHAGVTERAVVASGLHKILARLLSRPLGVFEPVALRL